MSTGAEMERPIPVERVANLVWAAKCIYDQITISDCYKHIPWDAVKNLREAWLSVERWEG